MKTVLILTLAMALAGSAAAQGDAAKTAEKPAPAVFAAQTACPVGNQPIDKDHFVDYEGHRVFFCCPKCPEKFKEFPDRYLYAMYLDGVAPESIQTVCVISGEPLEDRNSYVQVMNKRVYTCCKQCLKKVRKDPAKYFDQMEGRKAQTHCPVMDDEEVDPAVTTVFQGQRVNFCCKQCVGEFKKDPDLYYARWIEAKVITQPAAMTCPVSGMEAKGDLFMTWKGRRVNFCCPKCVAKFVKNPEKVLAAL